MFVINSSLQLERWEKTMNEIYRITGEATDDGFVLIEIIGGEFAGMKYSYSRVGIEEQNDTARLVYNYDVHSGTPMTSENRIRFQNLIGDILVTEMNAQVQQAKMIYRGGT